jgi:integrase
VWLIGLRGLRRGEACGLRWSEFDLDRSALFVVRNRTTAGYRVVEGPPKTAAGTHAVALDAHTLRVLREHRVRQADQRARWPAITNVTLKSPKPSLAGRHQRHAPPNNPRNACPPSTPPYLHFTWT